ERWKNAIELCRLVRHKPNCTSIESLGQYLTVRSRSASSTLVDEGGGGNRHQSRKGENGVDSVRILPLAPRRLKVCRHDRPLAAGDVHRVGEHPEDRLRRGQAEERSKGEKKGRAIAAYHERVQQGEQQRRNDGDAEEGPSRIDLLHGHVFSWRHGHLVGELEKMRAPWHQVNRNAHNRQ